MRNFRKQQNLKQLQSKKSKHLLEVLLVLVLPQLVREMFYGNRLFQINSDSVSIQLTQLTNELLPLLVSVAFSAWPTESISWSPLAEL